MESKKNTDEQAITIFGQIPAIVSKNKGFVIVYFHDGSRVIGIYKNSTKFSSGTLPTSSLPNKGSLDLADVSGKVTSYDFYDIKSLD